MTTAPGHPPPMDQIELIERSRRIFHFGLIGIVPVLGVPFALIATANHERIARAGGSQWNPAARERFWGAVCARFGIGLTIGGALILITKLLLDG